MANMIKMEVNGDILKTEYLKLLKDLDALKQKQYNLEARPPLWEIQDKIRKIKNAIYETSIRIEQTEHIYITIGIDFRKWLPVFD